MYISYQSLRTLCLSGVSCFAMIVSSCGTGHSEASQKGGDSTGAKAPTGIASAPKDTTIVNPAEPARGPLDTALYNKKLAQLSNGDSSGRWPASPTCAGS